MELTNIIITTRVAHAGMTVREALQECIEQQVSALPFCDEAQQVTGRVSVEGIFRFAGLPPDMVKSAHLLGDAIHHLNLTSDEVRQLLLQPVEAMADETLPTLILSSPLVKALVVMESFDTDCLFLLEDGSYCGTVTRFNIARLMLKEHSDDSAPG